MRRLALALAACLAAAGCWPQGPGLDAQRCGPAGPAEVHLFGDSLSAWSRAEACARFAVPVSYNAVGGTQLDHWAEAMGNIPAGATVVVSLGTNDVTNDRSTTVLADLHAVLDLLAPAACVVVPTLNTTGGDLRGWPYDVRTRAFNDELARLAAAGTYPNLRVVPWDVTSAGHPEWLVGAASSPSDWVHHAGAGVPYAEMLAAAPSACL